MFQITMLLKKIDPGKDDKCQEAYDSCTSHTRENLKKHQVNLIDIIFTLVINLCEGNPMNINLMRSARNAFRSFPMAKGYDQINPLIARLQTSENAHDYLYEVQDERLYMINYADLNKNRNIIRSRASEVVNNPKPGDFYELSQFVLSEGNPSPVYQEEMFKRIKDKDALFNEERIDEAQIAIE
jgi:hypothetical protein